MRLKFHCRVLEEGDSILPGYGLLKNPKNSKIMLDISGIPCYHVEVVERQTQNPGVAKFGIALEWGSRGLEFESRHSDQNQNSNAVLVFFL